MLGIAVRAYWFSFYSAPYSSTQFGGTYPVLALDANVARLIHGKARCLRYWAASVGRIASPPTKMPLLDHLEGAKLLKPQQMSTRVTGGALTRQRTPL